MRTTVHPESKKLGDNVLKIQSFKFNGVVE